MRNLRRKRIQVTVYLVIALLFIAIITIGTCFLASFEETYDESGKKVGNFVKTYNFMLTKTFDTYKEIDADVLSRTRLTASAIAADDPEKLQPGTFSDGYIVKVEGSKVTLPEEFPDEVYLKADFFTEEYSIWPSEGYTVSYAHIRGPFYFVNAAESNEAGYASVGENDINVNAALSNLANAYNCDYLIIQSGKVSEDTAILQGTNDYSDYSLLSEMGFSPKVYEGLNKKGLEGAFTKVNGRFQLLRLIHSEIDEDLKVNVILMLPVYNAVLRALEQSFMLLIIMMLIFIALSVWVFSIFETVRENILTADERIRYNPVTIRKKMAVSILVTSVLVLLSAVFIYSLDSLFIKSSDGEKILTEYISRVEDDEQRTQVLWEKSQARYINTAKHLAALIDDHRDLQNAEWLRKASKIIGADYIMIFDTDGNEVISSAHYRGMSLGKDESSATYDFRRLLRGVKEISHSDVKDEVTGLKRDMHGISLRYLSDEKSYGAMIIAVDPTLHGATVFSDLDEFADSAAAMAPPGGLIAGVDPETGDIEFCSKTSLKGKNMHDICKDVTSYEDSFMGFVEISGTDYYLTSKSNEGLVYYCATKQSEMFATVRPRAMYIFRRFLIAALILACILLYGYDQKTFDEYASVAIPSKDIAIVKRSRDKAKAATAKASTGLTRKQSAFMQTNYFSIMSTSLNPTERVVRIIRLLIIIFTLSVSAFILLDKANSSGTDGSNVLKYIAEGNWSRGFNLFSISAIIFLLCILEVGMSMLKGIGALLYSNMDTKSRTTFMMIINVLNYVAVIVFIFLTLGYLGVNTRALVASAGLAGIAFSLGAKDLISDIIAGFMILTDNSYHVGEIIQVGDYRGEVIEIGLRSTKIVGRGDNVKTIRNSFITDVVNYSRLNSWYPLIVTVSTSESLTKIEEILNAELPAIAQAHHEMITGPEYRGIDSINGDKMSLLILTECKEEHYNRIQRDVNREVRNIFKKHNIKML